jgi:hypothetical protein
MLVKMAAAEVRFDELEGGDLPPVCILTGARSDVRARLILDSNPSWTWILLLFGFFPFLIARNFAAVKVDAVIPFSDAAWNAHRRRMRIASGIALTGVAVLVAGISNGSSVLGIVGLAALVAGLVALSWEVTPVRYEVDARRAIVTLSGIHPRFVEEIARSRTRAGA